MNSYVMKQGDRGEFPGNYISGGDFVRASPSGYVSGGRVETTIGEYVHQHPGDPANDAIASGLERVDWVGR